MKTLWKRLSKENRAKLKSSATLYPSASVSLIDALKTNVAFTSLSFQHIIWLLQETTGQEVSINNVESLFKNK